MISVAIGLFLTHTGAKTEFPLYEDTADGRVVTHWVTVPESDVATDFEFVRTSQSIQIRGRLPKTLTGGAQALWEFWFTKPVKNEGAWVQPYRGVLLIRKGGDRTLDSVFGGHEMVFVGSNRVVTPLSSTVVKGGVAIDVPYTLIGRDSDVCDDVARYRPSTLPKTFEALSLLQMPHYFAGFVGDRSQSSAPDLDHFLDLYAPG